MASVRDVMRGSLALRGGAYSHVSPLEMRVASAKMRVTVAKASTVVMKEILTSVALVWVKRVAIAVSAPHATPRVFNVIKTIASQSAILEP